jgi:hypothetical protein
MAVRGATAETARVRWGVRGRCRDSTAPPCPAVDDDQIHAIGPTPNTPSSVEFQQFGQYGGQVEHEETYQGHRLVVISTEEQPGSWTFQVDLRTPDGRTPLLSNTGTRRYASAEDARRAGSSAAAGAVDRMRADTGKP